MKYCIECGTKLVEKELDKEGIIPYCPNCRAYRFPNFNVAVSMIVMNPQKDKILLIQQYGRKDFILVAGYVNKGEEAEHAVVRELEEETGLKAKNVHFNRSRFYEPSNTLMLNFTCICEDENLDNMTDEVDYAEWFSIEDARKNIKQDSLAQSFLEKFLEENHNYNN